jgi:hypothetical protein
MEGWGVKREPKKDTVAVHAPPPPIPHRMAWLRTSSCPMSATSSWTHWASRTRSAASSRSAALALSTFLNRFLRGAGTQARAQGWEVCVCVRVEGLCTHMCVLVRVSVHL